jgi:hypothetical protein
MVRGVPLDEAEALLARARASEPGDSEIGFALDLARAVNAVRERHTPAETRDALLALYAKQTRPDRHRAIVVDAVERATQVGADSVIEALAQRYVDDAEAGTAERRRAEQLYRQALVGRAFRRVSKGKLAEARADFEAVTKRTGSYEAVMGAIDLRLRAGERAADVRADYERKAAQFPPALSSFVKAYLLTRELPELPQAKQAEASAQALAALRTSWPELKAKSAAQALFGTLKHDEFLRTGDPASAQRANSHYLVALELARTNSRSRAMVLGRLALLHSEVGNYRIALGYSKERAELPYEDDAEGLAVRLADARVRLHVAHAADAATTADEALAMTERAAALAPYRVLALDRAALYNLAAGRFERSLALYDAEVPLLDAGPGAVAARNRFVVRLARVAAAMGAGQARRALGDLAEVDRLLYDATFCDALQWPHTSHEQVLRSYRLIAAGLRAKAHRDVGQLDAAARALETKHALLDERLGGADRSEFVRALTLVETQLAQNASERHDPAAAAAWAAKALKHADNLHERAPGAPDREQLDVLWLATSLDGAAPATPARADIRERLRKAQQEIAAHDDPALRTYERWFEIDLALTAPLAAPVESAPVAK